MSDIISVPAPAVDDRLLMDIITLELGFDFADLRTMSGHRVFDDETDERLRNLEGPIENMDAYDFGELLKARLPVSEPYELYSAAEDCIGKILEVTLPESTENALTYSIWTSARRDVLDVDLRVDHAVGGGVYSIALEGLCIEDIGDLDFERLLMEMHCIATIFRDKLVNFHGEVARELAEKDLIKVRALAAQETLELGGSVDLYEGLKKLSLITGKQIDDTKF